MAYHSYSSTVGENASPRRPVQVNPVQWPIALDSEMMAWRQFDSQFLSCDNRFRYAPGATRTITPTERLEIILSHNSLYVRATDLTKFLEKCPPEALKDNFKIIVDAIFSHHERDQSWELRTLRRNDHPRESAPVLKLLAPDGPIINLALRLMDDHNFLLEFTLDGLPFHLRQKLLQLNAPAFLAPKLGIVQSPGCERRVQHLLLNPFEYYIFCFGALNLLGVSIGRTTDYLNGWAALQDTLYTNILEEYLTYFFPCDGSSVPCHNFNYNAQQATEAVFLANSLLRQQHTKSKLGAAYHGDNSMFFPLEKNDNLPKLFKSTVLQEQPGNVGKRENLFLTAHPSAYKELWRSETILHTLMELWMSGLESLDKLDTLTSTSPLMFGGLPSVDVVKSVRTLVRHLHSFINCVNTHVMHPMEDIKRNSMPIFQRRLYIFLRCLFHYWPLDNSFRIVYETWLSYIQPWRYVTSDIIRNPDGLQEIIIDRRWTSFIFDNILFYSKLLSQMLLRLERTDLTATKNALMLYRLAKVFATEDNLKQMLVEIDSSVVQYERQLATRPTAQAQTITGPSRQLIFSTPTAGRNTASNSIGSYFGGGRVSPVSPPASGGSQQFFSHELTGNLNISNKLVHVKQLMKDHENPSYIYESIFSEANRYKVTQLLETAGLVSVDMYQSVCSSPETKKSCGWNMTKLLIGIWNDDSTPTDIAASQTQDQVRAAQHLYQARKFIAWFYDIPINDMELDETLPVSLNSNSQLLKTMDHEDPSSYVNGNSGTRILPAGILQDKDLVLYGNPDIALIRSDEYAPLVRLLHSVSSFLNDLASPMLEELYFASNWHGRFLRAILSEPMEFTEYKKQRINYGGIKKGLRNKLYLAPRVNLRPLASYYSLVWMFIMYMIGIMFGSGFRGMLLLCFGLYVIYVAFRAASEPVGKLEQLQRLHAKHTTIHFTTSKRIGFQAPGTREMNSESDPQEEMPRRRRIIAEDIGGAGDFVQ